MNNPTVQTKPAKQFNRVESTSEATLRTNQVWMKNVRLTLFAAAALTVLPDRADAAALWTSTYLDKRFIFAINDPELSKTPVWKTSEDNPPLAARKAIQAAQDRLSKLVPEPESWELETLRLSELNRGYWVYLVVFQRPQSSGAKTPMPKITIPVLMNGVALKPRTE